MDILKCSSSLNFKDRRILNPFLESLDPWLLDAHADREDLFLENFQKVPNVKKVKIEDFGIYIYAIRSERVNKVIRKKFFVLKRGFRHLGTSRNNFWKKIFWGRGRLTRSLRRYFSKIDKFQKIF